MVKKKVKLLLGKGLIVNAVLNIKKTEVLNKKTITKKKKKKRKK